MKPGQYIVRNTITGTQVLAVWDGQKYTFKDSGIRATKLRPCEEVVEQIYSEGQYAACDLSGLPDLRSVERVHSIG